MRRMFTIAAAALVLVGAVVLGARVNFERRIGREIDALLAGARPARRSITERELEPLPEPVQRWLRYSQVVGSAMPTMVHLRQEGQFQMEGKGWVPFEAEQHFTIDPPGFLWKARFRMAPLLAVSGRDQYRGGEGSIEMRLLSLVPVAAKRGGGLDQGALLRFLGEMQWFPAAALADYVAWEAVDGNSARATMTHGGITGSMTFRFGTDGRMTESTADRYNDSRDRRERWINRNDADQTFGRIRVPASGEARWEYESGPYPYIRWRITAIEQNHERSFEP